MISQAKSNTCEKKNPDFKIDFIGIGVSKAGTTWVSRMLDAHPEICMSEPKEVNYFNEQNNYYVKNWHTNYNKGLCWYKKHFPHQRDGKIIGEFTPKYFSYHEVPLRIKKSFPDAKLIVCLRNPVDRAFSQYNFIKYFKKKESRPFMEVIQNEPEYIEKGLYYKQLKRYLEYFEMNRIHIIWFEDIRNKPGEVLKELYRFLGVDETFNPIHANKKINAAREARFRQIPVLMNAFTEILTRCGLLFIIKAIKKTGLHAIVKKANARKIMIDPMPEEARRFLRKKFTDDIAELEKLLNKDLSHWK